MLCELDVNERQEGIQAGGGMVANFTSSRAYIF